MKKIWGLGTLLLSCAGGLAQFACSAGSHPETEITDGERKVADLIGSVPVESKSLDGIGSIGLVYDYGGYGGSFAGSFGGGVATAGFGTGGRGGEVPLPIPAGAPGLPSSGGAGGAGGSWFYPQCTGTLISKNSVLTSRSCGQLFEQTYYGYASLKFSIGANATQATRLIDGVDVEYAPAVSTNGSISYPDIAVIHLSETITDVTPFPVALLTEDLIDKPFAGVGFGNSDLRYQSGTRRAGSLVLRGTSGPLYPLIFGSFEAFYAYILGLGYYPNPGYGGFSGVFVEAGGFTGTAGSSAGGSPSAGAGGSFALAGSGGQAPQAGTGGSSNDWYRQYLEQQYDNTQLAPGEAFLGGQDSDAQPCGADQGGPMVRKLQGKVRVFGVFSHTPFGSCEKGAVYAGIDSATKAFVDAAAQWKDPCTDLTTTGKCVGTTATRCSASAEGKRRAVKFDCSLLNQVCVGGGNTEVACSDG